MPALQDYLLLVGGANLLDQRLSGLIGDDVIVLGDRVQDRNLDL